MLRTIRDPIKGFSFAEVRFGSFSGILFVPKANKIRTYLTSRPLFLIDVPMRRMSQWPGDLINPSPLNSRGHVFGIPSTIDGFIAKALVPWKGQRSLYLKLSWKLERIPGRPSQARAYTWKVGLLVFVISQKWNTTDDARACLEAYIVVSSAVRYNYKLPVGKVS